MRSIAEQFQLSGKPVSCEPMGNGHINRTYLVTDDQGSKYTLQKINDSIFKNVPALMENIRLVTEFLQKADPDPRHSLRLVPTKNGESYLGDESGYYRVYRFVEDSLCLERAESPEEFYYSAAAFGNFQNQLSRFDASLLNETIPRFHDTANRVNNLRLAAEKDALHRLDEVRAEYDFAMERAEEAGVMLGLLGEGKLKLRVTHNDTKLNNVLFDARTRKPICVIDLDTVMPGLAANDFGDSIRFGAATAAEDEMDLSLMTLSLPLYQAYVKGFLGACGSKLTRDEILTLPMGAKMMTFECGVRFLTDYLEGDTYFRIEREKQNLDRCRTQFKLVADMEKKWKDMLDIIEAEAGL